MAGPGRIGELGDELQIDAQTVLPPDPEEPPPAGPIPEGPPGPPPPRTSRVDARERFRAVALRAMQRCLVALGHPPTRGAAVYRQWD